MAAIDRAIEPGGAIASIRKSLFRGSTLVNAVRNGCAGIVNVIDST